MKCGGRCPSRYGSFDSLRSLRMTVLGGRASSGQRRAFVLKRGEDSVLRPQPCLSALSLSPSSALSYSLSEHPERQSNTILANVIPLTSEVDFHDRSG